MNQKEYLKHSQLQGLLNKNGVVEGKNKTLIEAARTMLEDSNLPSYFWAEAINTACFTQNISVINHAQGKPAY